MHCSSPPTDPSQPPSPPFDSVVDSLQETYAQVTGDCTYLLAATIAASARVLGVPVGSTNYKTQYVEGKLKIHQGVLALLQSIPGLHPAITADLIKTCSKDMTFLATTVEPSIMLPFAQIYDATTAR